MIIPNGTIEFIENTPGGLDDNGYPIAASKSYGCPVPCQFIANSRDTLGKTNGETFIRASYSVYIEWIDRCSCRFTELVRLKSRHGKTIGEYHVLDIEPLEAVCQVRILI